MAGSIRGPLRITYRSEMRPDESRCLADVWWVVAYAARADTMDGAMELGRIRRTILEQRPLLWALWQAELLAWLIEFYEDIGMEPSAVITTSAPGHERQQ